MRNFRLHLPDDEYDKIQEFAKVKKMSVDDYIQTALYLILHNVEMVGLIDKNLESGVILGRNE